MPDAPAPERITAVGDDDQSIYGFQGATGNFGHFEACFSAVRRVLLEQNFRSTGTIVGAAAALIAHNGARVPKCVHTANAAGGSIQVVECRDAECEARYVVRELRRLFASGVRPSSVALLFRTARTGSAMQAALCEHAIPFNTHAANFWEAKPLRDLLALLRLLLNPADDVLFGRVLKAVAPSRAKVRRAVPCGATTSHTFSLLRRVASEQAPRTRPTRSPHAPARADARSMRARRHFFAGASGALGATAEGRRARRGRDRCGVCRDAGRGWLARPPHTGGRRLGSRVPASCARLHACEA